MITIKDIKFEYSFVSQGSTLENINTNAVCLDVGNKLAMGYIDHHQLKNGLHFKNKTYSCTTSLVSISTDLFPIPKNKKIEIITHTCPDFDSIAATYLFQEYLIKGEFPKHSDLLIEYLELVDSGKLLIDENSFKSPAMIVHFFESVIDSILAPNSSTEEKNTLMLKRGLDFIDYILKRLDSFPLSEQSLFNPNLILDNSEFNTEIFLLESDYAKYLDDLKNLTIRDKLQLPSSKSKTAELIEVDALFWTSKPTCVLHKYWARSDTSAPLGQGYVFTFIPEYLNSKIILNKENSSGIHHKDILNDAVWSRVIISVNPNSDVNLLGLAQKLEESELIAEIDYFSKYQNIQNYARDRSTKRFPDYWIKNSDPWYDGRNFNYTIVDSPRRGSLLSVDKIINIVKVFTDALILENRTKFLFPFYYNKKNESNRRCFVSFCSFLERNKNFDSISFSEDSNMTNEFFPYIQNYLFNINSDSQKKAPSQNRFCKSFSLTTNIALEVNCSNFNTNPLIVKVSLLVFRYGLGYITLDLDQSYTSNDFQNTIYLQDILNLNQEICKSSKIIKKLIFTHFSPVQKKYNISVDEGIIYTQLRIDGNKLYQCKHSEIIYNLCSKRKSSDITHEKEFIDSLSENFKLLAGKDIIYGFGKGGGCQLVGVKSTDIPSIITKKQYYWEKFFETDFYIFILSLHQRTSLMNFTEKLSNISGSSKSMNRIRRLRYDLMNFMTQGWFSQVTENELGMNLYTSWDKVFQNKILYEEVTDQLSSVDEYNNAQWDKKISRITTLFLPVILLDSIFTIGVFEGINPIKVNLLKTLIIIVCMFILLKINLNHNKKY